VAEFGHEIARALTSAQPTNWQSDAARHAYEPRPVIEKVLDGSGKAIIEPDGSSIRIPITPEIWAQLHPEVQKLVKPGEDMIVPLK
jgi:hypothetical protein